MYLTAGQFATAIHTIFTTLDISFTVSGVNNNYNAGVVDIMNVTNFDSHNAIHKPIGLTLQIAPQQCYNEV